MKRKPFDFWLFLTVFVLISLGIVMVFSSSAPYAYNTFNNVYHILTRQVVAAMIGFAAMFFMINYDYRKLGKWSPVLMIVSIVLLILVLVPGIGHETKGTWRWFYIGGQQFQPSEIAKMSVILFFAYSLSKRKDKLKYFTKGLLPYLGVLGIIAFLLLKEPHLSCTIIIVSVASIILFSAGARIMHFVLLAVPAVCGFAGVIMMKPYMMARVVSFMDPFKDMKGDGWQAVQSLFAIGSGGLFGRGIGMSQQKYLYIPEPHNDFIFSVIAEELGYIGVAAVLLLFLIFIWRGIKIATSAPDVFGSLTAIGITSLIAVQMFLNVAVVTSSMPPTGVSLPLFSYGGTALVIFMFQIGILLNISRYCNYERI